MTHRAFVAFGTLVSPLASQLKGLGLLRLTPTEFLLVPMRLDQNENGDPKKHKVLLLRYIEKHRERERETDRQTDRETDRVHIQDCVTKRES